MQSVTDSPPVTSTYLLTTQALVVTAQSDVLADGVVDVVCPLVTDVYIDGLSMSTIDAVVSWITFGCGN